MFTWINPRILDKLVFELRKRGIYVARHSYSYRLFYQEKIVAGIHVYPGYDSLVIRVYMVHIEIADKVLREIVETVKRVFPGYNILIQYLNPLIEQNKIGEKHVGKH